MLTQRILAYNGFACPSQCFLPTACRRLGADLIDEFADGVVDHVGSAGTRYVTGDLIECDLAPPPVDRMPQIRPPD